jgi:prepilin-type N-terminal cleavage/methylation domain-containing protein
VAAACRRAGFTLVEILFTVVLIGVLAALAVPMYQRISRKANDTLFLNELRVASHSLERYAMEKGDWPPDGAGGWPEEMREFLPPPDRWNQPTPIGGTWCWTRDSEGLHAALRVTGTTAGPERVLALDRASDDGDLASGFLRGVGGDLVYVLQE